MKRKMTEAENRAKEICRDCILKEGFHDGYVIRFSSHQTTFKNYRTGEKVTLNTGYGLYFKDDGSVYCDNKDGMPVPWDSYWEALANLGDIAWKRVETKMF